MIYLMQKYTTLLYLMNFIIKKSHSINIILRYLLLEIISKNLIKIKFYIIILMNLKYKTLII